jgi:1-deoxy-D-xylulose-5-phosphate reductoisomerase
MTVKKIVLLGSTGSIGTNVLSVVRDNPDRFRITALSAGTNIELLADQVREFTPERVSIADPALAARLASLLPDRYQGKILTGTEGNCILAGEVDADMVVTAVVGAVGLQPTLAAIAAGRKIGLANKETLVMAGRLVMSRAREKGVSILPIDSEHSAIFQALEAGRSQDVGRILLTASGGPFRTLPADAFSAITPEQALAHPNWEMGRKISIDSSTLMNKGLEVIEARWLFDMEPDRIDVVVHAESVIHSLVEYVDGSVIAQLGIPDMRIPIAYALSYPERIALDLPRLSLAECGSLHFAEPDHGRFPALAMAFAALADGGMQPAVLNGANEIAVEAFLDGRIGYTDITAVVAETLAAGIDGDDMDMVSIMAADQEARRLAAEQIRRRSR